MIVRLASIWDTIIAGLLLPQGSSSAVRLCPLVLHWSISLLPLVYCDVTALCCDVTLPSLHSLLCHLQFTSDHTQGPHPHNFRVCFWQHHCSGSTCRSILFCHPRHKTLVYNGHKETAVIFALVHFFTINTIVFSQDIDWLLLQRKLFELVDAWNTNTLPHNEGHRLFLWINEFLSRK